jgi:hypothetical protein
MKKIHFAALVSVAAVAFGGCASNSEEIESTDSALGTGIREVVTCQSWDHRYTQCNVDTQGGSIVSVRVNRQLSSTACDDSSFGSGDSYVWVDHGCRADLEVIIQTSGGRGDITLFEDDNFGGRTLHLSDTTYNFDPIGFNDMVSSFIIRRGTWQLCTAANFRGECPQYGPGEYRSVGGHFNDKFSSARLVSSW